jgi:hypothetical protein
VARWLRLKDIGDGNRKAATVGRDSYINIFTNGVDASYAAVGFNIYILANVVVCGGRIGMRWAGIKTSGGAIAEEPIVVFTTTGIVIGGIKMHGTVGVNAVGPVRITLGADVVKREER